MNHEHHQEQMEAARKEFNEFWENKIEPRLEQMETPHLRRGIILDIAWFTFKHAKGIQPDKD